MTVEKSGTGRHQEDVRDVPVEEMAIQGVLLVRPRRFEDTRGYFSETYSRRDFAAIGIEAEFVQDNFSYSRFKGTIRGLHFQYPPFVQAKLVRVLRGAVFDVAVDLRRGSATYGRHVGAVLTAAGGEQLFVPEGFAHGFCTLEADVEVAYKVSGYYSRQHDAGLRWDDSDLAIPWPLDGAEPLLSDKDRALPLLSAWSSPFDYAPAGAA